MRTSLLLALLFAACGGSDAEPKTPSTTQAKPPDEKSEENIQMSPGAPEAAKPKESKPAPAPAPAPAPDPAPAPPPK